MVTDLERSLHHVASYLADRGRPWALVGGLAVAIRAQPRLTRDVDVAVATADDAEAESFVSSLLGEGYGVVAIVEHELSGRLATARLEHPSWSGTLTDLLFASCGIEPEIAAAAELLEALPDLRVPVARVGHLMAMKLLAEGERRPFDRADLLALAQVATDEDWDLARQGVDTIAERGFQRGRDLGAALDALASRTDGRSSS